MSDELSLSEPTDDDVAAGERVLLAPLEEAILDVLSGAARGITRAELGRTEAVTRIRSDAKSIREAVKRLLELELIAEPRGKGRGLEIAPIGRWYVNRSPRRMAG